VSRPAGQIRKVEKTSTKIRVFTENLPLREYLENAESRCGATVYQNSQVVNTKIFKRRKTVFTICSKFQDAARVLHIFHRVFHKNAVSKLGMNIHYL